MILAPEANPARIEFSERTGDSKCRRVLYPPFDVSVGFEGYGNAG